LNLGLLIVREEFDLHGASFNIRRRKRDDEEDREEEVKYKRKGKNKIRRPHCSRIFPIFSPHGATAPRRPETSHYR
jgi:hypothetical protein